MKDQLERMLDKLDALDERLNKIEVTLERNTVTVEDHARRSDLLEMALEQIWDEIKPVQAHVDKVEGALKVFGGLCAAVGALAAILKIVGVI